LVIRQLQKRKYPWFGRRPLSGKRMAMATIISGVMTALLFLLITTVWFPIHIQIPIPGSKSGFTISTGFSQEKVILVMGIDTNYQSTDKEHDHQGTRSDTMMLVRLRPRENTLSLLSIPRDSRVFVGGTQRVDKINAAHAEGGPALAVQTVEQTLGVPVDHFVVVNFSGVRDLVDALGGVDVYVEKPMHYEDHTAKLFIHFDAGPAHLDGKQAEAFLRFRHDALADIGRIKRQQQFITAVSNKLKNPLMLANLPRLVQLGVQYVKTDMSFDELTKLAFYLKGVDMKNIRSATLPGHPRTLHGVSYWCIDKQQAEMTLDRVVLDQELVLNDPTNPIKVGILYANQQQVQYQRLKERLEEKGYRVVCHAVQNKSSTQLLEQTDRATTRETRRLRLIDPVLEQARLMFAPPGSTYAAGQCGGGEDYTVVIGPDFKG
jgi:polyisoprenyl-teichoic acid--peptidoglycan teichoic acid transferase